MKREPRLARLVLHNMHLSLKRSTIRDLRPGDAQSLSKHANNPKIARFMRDLFPSPYDLADAQSFIETAIGETPPCHYAIEIEGVAVGVIGVKLKSDVERIGAEFGYWIGEQHWGRGVMSEIIPAFTRFALNAFHLTRLEAIVYDGNDASARVLEKAGFVCEGTLRKSAIKNGRIIDRRLFAHVVE